jgi:hypothetical protein
VATVLGTNYDDGPSLALSLWFMMNAKDFFINIHSWFGFGIRSRKYFCIISDSEQTYYLGMGTTEKKCWQNQKCVLPSLNCFICITFHRTSGILPVNSVVWKGLCHKIFEQLVFAFPQYINKQKSCLNLNDI